MANNEFDALDALEREAKEYDKVSRHDRTGLCERLLISTTKDAEIDRILKAFKLDA